MENKVVIFNGDKYIRHPKSKYYFKYATRNKDRENAQQLHRAVWIFYNGEIPKGYQIHHIDHNVDNNDIANLACISRSEHLSQHAKENMQNEEFRKQAKENLDKARVKANEWHGSKEGKEWHRKHTMESLAKTWEHNIKKTCKYCGKDFFGTALQEYCDKKCYAKYRWRVLGK